MRRQEIKGTWLGKRNILLNGSKIKTSLYIDELGQFIMVKGERIKVKEKGNGLVVIW